MIETCPRCGREIDPEGLYGPCSECRADLCHKSEVGELHPWHAVNVKVIER
jgi:hypothetical protein